MVMESQRITMVTSCPNGAWMCAPRLIGTHSSVADTFHNTTSWWRERKCQGFIGVSKIHPLSNLNVQRNVNANYPLVAEIFQSGPKWYPAIWSKAPEVKIPMSGINFETQEASFF